MDAFAWYRIAPIWMWITAHLTATMQNGEVPFMRRWGQKIGGQALLVNSLEDKLLFCVLHFSEFLHYAICTWPNVLTGAFLSSLKLDLSMGTWLGFDQCNLDFTSMMQMGQSCLSCENILQVCKDSFRANVKHFATETSKFNAWILSPIDCTMNLRELQCHHDNYDGR